ncbi:phage minor head protein [Nocardia cyriacigeorgica]|uniref:phage minor head protein n=1 Tax=Nocardia cyriacigeorgica TaxID=135487 RepID=UPI002454511C|nr:phage minor head protein [Nocardia cyriacigeorgica]
MIPPTRRAALLTTLQMERRVKRLARDSYARWLPIARAAVLPGLTAAAEESPPPQPEQLALTQAAWEEILAAVFLPGMAAILWEQLTAEMTNLGITATEVIRLASEAAARSGLPGTTPGGDEPDTDDQPGAGESDSAPAQPPRGDQERAEPRRDDEDGPLTPELVARIPSVQEWVEAYLAAVNNRMVRTPDTAFRLIADDLSEAVAEGESIPQQGERIARILDAENLETFGGRRPALVARTETAGALNAARLESARVQAEITGEVLHKVWLATIDNRTRATHFAVDGQRVPSLDGEFELPNGVKMRWPGEPGAPAAEVCNCRCALMILAEDEEIPAEDDRQTERGPGDANVRNRAGSRQDEIDRRREEDGIVRARDDPDGVGQINAAAPPPERIPTMQTFTAVLAHLGVATDDGRYLDPDMDLRFRDTPLPLRWQRQAVDGHGDAFTVGAIDTISVDGTKIVGTGHLLDTAEAAEAALQVREGVTGPSIDLADVEWEIRDEKGRPIEDLDDIDEDSKLLAVMTSGIVTAATLVSIPAFGNTSITLDDDVDADVLAAAEYAHRDDELLLAAATAPRFRPSGTMFADPGFTEPTPLHMTDDGRIVGHLATFGTCHVGIADRCVTPPRSVTGYAHFHTSAITLDDGVRLPVGRLTVGAGHAGHGLSPRAAAEHYDTLCTTWAYVRAGEDAFGPWVSGVPHPDATEEQIRDGLSAPLSGDWRNIGGNLELVAALSVNTPGFPVLRGREDEYGRPQVLVASLAPRYRRQDAEDKRLRAVAREAVREYNLDAARRTAAHAIIARRRRAQARDLIAALNNRKG